MAEHPAEPDSMLRVEGLKKVFRSGESDLVLFENLSFTVRRGEMLAIVGESGAGKSTLLHILSALDRASAGNVYCAQLQLNALSADGAGRRRSRKPHAGCVRSDWSSVDITVQESFRAESNSVWLWLGRSLPVR